MRKTIRKLTVDEARDVVIDAAKEWQSADMETTTIRNALYLAVKELRRAERRARAHA